VVNINFTNTKNYKNQLMPFLSGEFECKLDPKSRMMLPSGFKKKLPEIETDGFVINRGSGSRKFLQLYTAKDWETKLAALDELDQYDEDDLTVIRYFMNGATEFMPDALGRIVLPKCYCFAGKPY
jgi:MraZ protein